MNYNIPSNNRELQPSACTFLFNINYNIPSNNRELQQSSVLLIFLSHYNIPSNNRELQQIVRTMWVFMIITYQVITGNYSVRVVRS